MLDGRDGCVGLMACACHLARIGRVAPRPFNPAPSSRTACSLFQGVHRKTNFVHTRGVLSMDELRSTLFGKLEITLESIQKYSQMFLVLYDQAEAVVQVWLDAVYNSDSKSVLPLMYIANDVVQCSKRRGTAYVNSFKEHIKTSLRISASLNPSIVPKLKRIVNVWGDRKVYPRQTIKWIEGAFNNNEAEHDGTPPNTPPADQGSDSPPPTPSPNFSPGPSAKKSDTEDSPTYDLDAEDEKEAESMPLEETIVLNEDMEKLGEKLKQRMQDVDDRVVDPDSIQYALQTGQVTFRDAKEKVLTLARLVKQYDGFVPKHDENKKRLITKLQEQIEKQEELQRALNSKLEEVKEAKEILQEIQAQATTAKERKEVILRKTREVEVEKAPEKRKIEWGDEEMDAKRRRTALDILDEPLESENVQYVWDRITKQMVPVKKSGDHGEDSWREK